MPKHEKMSDVDKQIIADGLKEISGLIRDRPEILGLMIGFGAQAALSSVALENRKRGWEWSTTELVWVTIDGAHRIAEWDLLRATYAQELAEWERDTAAYEAYQRKRAVWVECMQRPDGDPQMCQPLHPGIAPPHPGGKPATPFGATERPVQHQLVGVEGLQILRNYGFVSPLLHSVQSQWAEAGLMGFIGLQPWSDNIMHKAGDGVKKLADWYMPDDFADAAAFYVGGPVGYPLWKWLFK